MKKLTRNAVLMTMVMIMSLTFIQCKDAAVNKFIDLQVEAENKKCPVDMGGGLIMEKCESIGDKTIKYTFTVPDAIAPHLKLDDPEAKSDGIKALKAMKEFKQIKEMEVSYAYAYYDTKKNLLGEMKITPEDYK